MIFNPTTIMQLAIYWTEATESHQLTLLPFVRGLGDNFVYFKDKAEFFVLFKTLLLTPRDSRLHSELKKFFVCVF